MFCTKCGKEVGHKAKFCGDCGQKTPGGQSDHSDTRFPVSLFVGRIGRANYFLGQILIVLPMFAIFSLWGVLSLLGDTFVYDNSLFESLTTILVGVLFICWIPLHVGLIFRRCHDIGSSWLASLWLLVPYVNIIPAAYLLFKRGDDGPNKYGQQPTNERSFLESVFNY